MNIHNAEITISAVRPSQYPAGLLPEIALAGRSNVGKSSFLNKLLGRKNLARTSSSPGKTATLNFYNIDDTMFFADLPGYGYAKVSKTELEKWANMITTYLELRRNLKAVFILVDARHCPTNDDLSMFNWIKCKYGSVTVIVTKCDKVAKTKLVEHLEVINSFLKLEESDLLIPFSSQTGMGYDESWDIINKILAKKITE